MPHPATPRRRWEDSLFGLYLAVIGVFAACIELKRGGLHTPQAWSTADWLTNYSAGFIRRGLPGELLLLGTRALHLNLAATALMFEMGIYFVFLWCSWKLIQRSSLAFPIKALLLSPATFAFIVLNPSTGFRKEILLFAALALLILALPSFRISDWQLSVLLSVIGIVLVLSHEALFFYFPYFVAAIAIHAANFRSAIRITWLPAILSLAALILVSHHPGNRQMAQQICTSIGGTGGPQSLPLTGSCRGSIQSLSRSLTDAQHLTQGMLRAYSHVYFFIYPLLAVLALVPAAFAMLGISKRSSTGRRTIQIIVICAVASGLASSALFYIATDWGRWIHIHIVCLTLLLLMADAKTASAPLVQPRPSIAWTIALLLYATCWTLPVNGAYAARLGYYDLFRVARGYHAWEPPPPPQPPS